MYLVWYIKVYVVFSFFFLVGNKVISQQAVCIHSAVQEKVRQFRPTKQTQTHGIYAYV